MVRGRGFIKKVLYPAELIEIIRNLPQKEGWVRKKQVIDKIMELKDCSLPTAYKILDSHKAILKVEYGRVKLNLPPSLKLSEDEFQRWLDSRNKILDNIVEFLNKQPPSPKKDDIFVRINVIREELSGGLDYGMEELFIRLERQYKVKKEFFGIEEQIETEKLERLLTEKTFQTTVEGEEEEEN